MALLNISPSGLIDLLRLVHEWGICTYIYAMKLILESGRAQKLMGLKIHHGSVKLANSLEWHSVVVSVRYMLISTSCSNLKKDLRLPYTTFSNSDWNYSIMEFYRETHIKSTSSWTTLEEQKWHNFLFVKIRIVDHRLILLASLWF